MGKLGTITRRTFLISAVAITGGVVFGYWKYKQPHGNPLLKDIDEGAGALTPYVLIDQNGISIVAPRAEMGQGIHTTLAAMVAEELDVTLEQVNVLHGPASKAYFNAVFMEDGLPFASLDESGLAEGARSFTEIPAKLIGMQLTGGSTSTYDHYDKMRTAGAAARESLLQAAANKTGIDVGSLSTSNGRDSGIYGFRDLWIQGFKDSGIQGFMDSRIRGFRVSGIIISIIKIPHFIL